MGYYAVGKCKAERSGGEAGEAEGRYEGPLPARASEAGVLSLGDGATGWVRWGVTLEFSFLGRLLGVNVRLDPKEAKQ